MDQKQRQNCTSVETALRNRRNLMMTYRANRTFIGNDNSEAWMESKLIDSSPLTNSFCFIFVTQDLNHCFSMTRMPYKSSFDNRIECYQMLYFGLEKEEMV